MFGKQSKKQSKIPKPEETGNVPKTAYTAAKSEWLERMGGPVVERTRWFLMAMALTGCLIAALFAIASMAPLKTVIPYIIEVDKITGDARASQIEAKRYTIDDKQKKYFIGRWVKKTVDLDPYTTESSIKEAFMFVRGKAIDEYRSLMQSLRPMERLAKDKTLTRTVNIISINFIAEGSALVRFTTEERTGSGDPFSKRFVANIHFEVVPPVTEKDILENPNGIFITHFAIQEEIQ